MSGRQELSACVRGVCVVCVVCAWCVCVCVVCVCVCVCVVGREKVVVNS